MTNVECRMAKTPREMRSAGLGLSAPSCPRGHIVAVRASLLPSFVIHSGFVVRRLLRRIERRLVILRDWCRALPPQSGSVSFVILLSLAPTSSPGIAQDAPPEDDFARKLEIDKKHRALRERLREPYLVEAKSFKLFLDRRDPSFRIEDSESGLDWHSAPDRRGFASLLVPRDDGGTDEIPIDGMDDVRVDSNSIHFTGRSSRGPIPDLRFVLEVTSPLVGLQLRFELDAAAAARGVRVKLLDRGLWILDSGGGGVLSPGGSGTLHDVRVAEPMKETVGADTRLRGLGLINGETSLVVVWDSPRCEVTVSRRENRDSKIPGKWVLDVSIVIGEATGGVRIYPLGRSKLPRVVDSYRQLVTYGQSMSTLRVKTASERLRSLIGAAVFRPSFHAASETGARDFAALAKVARRIRQRLGIDSALFLLDDWRDSIDPETPRSIDARAALGGDAGLVALAEILHGQGHLLGLELPVRDLPSIAESEPWREELEDLADRVDVDLLFAGGKGAWPASTAAELKDLRDRELTLGRDLAGLFPLVGTPFFDEIQLGHAAYVEGGRAAEPARGPDAFPFFEAVHGQHARLMSRPPSALGPGDAEAFLDCLLLAELPIYQLPTVAGDPPEKVVSPAANPLLRSDGGWYEVGGKSYSASERFLKTTYEVLSHVARLRSRNTVNSFRTLDPDGKVQEVYYGFDLRIVVNRGEKPYVDPDRGFVLPKYGFWVQHPFFFAFHASKAFDVSYPTPALFTLQSLEGKLWLRAESVRIWHAFGPTRIDLGGKTFRVPGELITRIW